MPDSLPVIGRATKFDNVFYAFGHGHVGLCSGAPTGRIVADLIAGRQPNIDVTPYRPDRF
jgi:D-amino-acid dehydrogenase